MGVTLSSLKPGLYECNLCPTQVGVTLFFVSLFQLLYLLCPTQVGVTLVTDELIKQVLTFAPHRWGLLYENINDENIEKLCPTQVGVTLFDQKGNLKAVTLPHTGGGYSE